MIKKLTCRFNELTDEADKIAQTNAVKYVEFDKYDEIDIELFDEWKVKVKSLIAKACGDDSVHMKAFIKAEKPMPFSDSYSDFKRVRSVFRAAKDDFQGGFLISIRNLVQAELFDSELEQAKELLDSGYKGPAAVVAGIVLETALRDICSNNSIAHAKLDKMNSELVKIGVYNKLQQKRITALADIRNSAAHGDWESFDNNDVTEMIRDVEKFLSSHLV